MVKYRSGDYTGFSDYVLMSGLPFTLRASPGGIVSSYEAGVFTWKLQSGRSSTEPGDHVAYITLNFLQLSTIFLQKFPKQVSSFTLE